MSVSVVVSPTVLYHSIKIMVLCVVPQLASHRSLLLVLFLSPSPSRFSRNWSSVGVHARANVVGSVMMIMRILIRVA